MKKRGCAKECSREMIEKERNEGVGRNSKLAAERNEEKRIRKGEMMEKKDEGVGRNMKQPRGMKKKRICRGMV
jgi:hypothetical protein